MCIADYNQDAVLLVDINDRIVFNRNDASDLGWGGFVRGLLKGRTRSFLLGLSSRFSDADMCNYFDENGQRLPLFEGGELQLGGRNAHRAEVLGARYFVPFSSMHVYQRSDSVWLREYATTLEDYGRGFRSERCELLPTFVRYDCCTRTSLPMSRSMVTTAVPDRRRSWTYTWRRIDIEHSLISSGIGSNFGRNPSIDDGCPRLQPLTLSRSGLTGTTRRPSVEVRPRSYVLRRYHFW